MSKRLFVRQELAKRGIDYPACDDPDSDGVYSYTDEEHTDEQLPGESPHAGKHRKSPRRKELEQRFLELHAAYMRPEQPLTAYREQCLLEDLYELTWKLNQGWVHYKAMRYRQVFEYVDEDLALSIGCNYVYGKLVKNKRSGIFVEHALAYYLRLAQNKTIDKYFRKKFGRLPKPKAEADPEKPAEEPKPRLKSPRLVSLDAAGVNRDGDYTADRHTEFSCDPFSELRRPRWERDDKARRLCVVYLQTLMDYPYEPQKPLAVMYGSCLFQLAKQLDNEEPLTLLAKRSNVLSSKEWAFARMGESTLRQLGAESETIVESYYRSGLSWGEAFAGHMAERDESGKAKWADIVYTRTYTKAETSNWMESVSKSSVIRAARQVLQDPDLLEYILETLSPKNKFRRALESLQKGAKP